MNEFHGNCQECGTWNRIAFVGSMSLSQLLCKACSNK